MNGSIIHPHGLFELAKDGRLLFFALPKARTAFVVPDANRAEALRQASKHWGIFELATMAIVAPLALHFGAAGLLAAFIVFAVSSATAYTHVVRQMVAGLDRVVLEPRAMRALSAGTISCLRTLSAETHAGFLWFYQVAVVFPFAGAVLMALSAHSASRIVGGLVAIVFFGSGGLAVSYMLALKHGGAAVDRARTVETRRATV
jgi:hypothetical protein